MAVEVTYSDIEIWRNSVGSPETYVSFQRKGKSLEIENFGGVGMFYAFTGSPFDFGSTIGYITPYSRKAIDLTLSPNGISGLNICCSGGSTTEVQITKLD